MTRLRAEGNLDLDQLTDLIKETLDKVWGQDWGIFTDDNPTGNDSIGITLPHITYNLLERKVATSHGTPKYTQFDQEPDPEHPGHHITYYRKWFNCDLEFCIYAKTRHECMKQAQRFEDFMDDYIGYFKEQGISEIQFEIEESPKVSSEYRQDIPHRTVRYLVRIERIKIQRSIDLTQVKTNVVAAPQFAGAASGGITPVPGVTPTPSGSNLMTLYNQYFPK